MNERPPFAYRAFGMRIESAIPLELPPANNPLSPRLNYVDAAKLDTTIVSIRMDETLAQKNDLLPHPLWHSTYGKVGDHIEFDFPGLARFSVNSNNTIAFGIKTIDTSSESARKASGMIATYIEGLLLPILLKLQGIVAFHGSAVAGELGAIILIGDKGSGKSTTATALASHGFKVLGDDVVPLIPGSPTLVLPGIPIPRLLPDAYDRFAGTISGWGMEGETSTPRTPRFNLSGKCAIRAPDSDLPSPLLAIVELSAENAPLSLAETRGAAKITTLMSHALFLQHIDEPHTNFERCAAVAATSPLHVVRRPIGEDSLDTIVDLLSKLLGKNPSR